MLMLSDYHELNAAYLWAERSCGALDECLAVVHINGDRHLSNMLCLPHHRNEIKPLWGFRKREQRPSEKPLRWQQGGYLVKLMWADFNGEFEWIGRERIITELIVTVRIILFMLKELFWTIIARRTTLNNTMPHVNRRIMTNYTISLSSS